MPSALRVPTRRWRKRICRPPISVTYLENLTARGPQRARELLHAVAPVHRHGNDLAGRWYNSADLEHLNLYFAERNSAGMRLHPDKTRNRCRAGQPAIRVRGIRSCRQSEIRNARAVELEL